MERLLSFVLNTEVSRYLLIGTTVQVFTRDGSLFREFNVHELAYLCKEWASKHGFEVFSTALTCFVTDVDGTDILIRFDGKKEYLAICLACQWIAMHNKENISGVGNEAR